MRRVFAVVLLAGLAACADHETDAAARSDSLTQRQRDSVIGASKLPGAQGVQGALQADSAARARAERLSAIDSVP